MRDLRGGALEGSRPCDRRGQTDKRIVAEIDRRQAPRIAFDMTLGAIGQKAMGHPRNSQGLCHCSCLMAGHARSIRTLINRVRNRGGSSVVRSILLPLPQSSQFVFRSNLNLSQSIYFTFQTR
jgi:hypothetical protein